MSPCRTCVRIVIASRWRTTFGGSLPCMEGCSGPEQSRGHTRQCRPPSNISVSSARCAAKSWRQLDQLAGALDKPAERWRQSSQDGCAGFARQKSAQNTGRVQKVHYGGQVRISEGGRSASRNNVHEGGEAKVYDGFTASCCSRRRG